MSIILPFVVLLARVLSRILTPSSFTLKCSRGGTSFGVDCAMFSSSNLFRVASFKNSDLLLYPLVPRVRIWSITAGTTLLFPARFSV